MSCFKKFVYALTAILACIAILFFTVLPGWVDRLLNTPASLNHSVPPGERIPVADLHADTLLWGRDLLHHSDYGAVDLPRLREGGSILQGFTIVSKMPLRSSLEHTVDSADLITLLAWGEHWPWATRWDLLERTLYKAHRLNDAVNASQGKMHWVRSRAELDALLEARRSDPEAVGVFLGVEGAHALVGDPANLDRLAHAGVRMVGLTHFFDNEFAGSAHGADKGGLTDKGRELIRRMEQKHILLDLSHISELAFDQALAQAQRPVLVSHTGVKGTCNNVRNLSDAQLQKVAATGGVIGIGFWPTAVCGKDTASIAKAIAYAVQVAGETHVALGSDFDGAVKGPFDVAGIQSLVPALREQGLNEQQIRLVMSENVLRLLRETLP